MAILSIIQLGLVRYGQIGRRLLSGKAAANYRFVDFSRIVVKGGCGGQGCISFQRLRDGKRGRANGGNGGNGGDVIIRASSSLLGLSIHSTKIQGQNGMNGGPDLSQGQQGRPTVIQVPCGTVIRFLNDDDHDHNDHNWLDMFHAQDTESNIGDTDFHQDQDQLVRTQREIDLANDGDEVLVAKGGRGGMGNRTSNMRYKKGICQLPESGAKGERVRLEIELKIMADIGLVGYPNAGKSTLLSAICQAKPKIADYPFTTLRPNLGVVEFDDIERSRCTVADIPGLIAGASDNRGLGHEFLRHIERTKLILYVLDLAGTESRDPLDDYRQLRHELSLYNDDLVRQPALIFANKIDRRPATCSKNLERLRQEAGCIPIVAGSAMTGRNLDQLRRAIYELIPRSKTW